MAYEKGLLKRRWVTDTRTEDYEDGTWWCLPHSCEEWVIGTRAHLEALAADIAEALVTADEEEP